MSNKVQKTYRLSDDTVSKLEKYAAEHNLTATAAVEYFIKNGVNADYNHDLAQLICDELEKRFNSWSKGVLLSSRQSERYGFQMIEMLNSLIQNLLPPSEETYLGTHRLDAYREKQSGNNLAAVKYSGKVSKTYTGSLQETREYYSELKQRKDSKNSKN